MGGAIGAYSLCHFWSLCQFWGLGKGSGNKNCRWTREGRRECKQLHLYRTLCWSLSSYPEEDWVSERWGNLSEVAQLKQAEAICQLPKLTLSLLHYAEQQDTERTERQNHSKCSSSFLVENSSKQTNRSCLCCFTLYNGLLRKRSGARPSK